MSYDETYVEYITPDFFEYEKLFCYLCGEKISGLCYQEETLTNGMDFATIKIRVWKCQKCAGTKFRAGESILNI